MNKAEEPGEFLTKKGIFHNVKYKTDSDEITLTELLDEYAQQVSKEIAIDFYISHVNNPTNRIYISKEFDKWIKDQQ